MENNSVVVALSEKYLLTVKEASAYFGVGEKRLRFILNNNPSLTVFNGERTMVHRKKFEKFIDETSSI